LLNCQKVLALKESGDQRPLSSLLESVDLPEGRRRVSDYLAAQPYPHYEAAPDRPGMLVRIDESGIRTIGRFVNREFQPVEAKTIAKKRTGKKASRQQGKGR